MIEYFQFYATWYLHFTTSQADIVLFTLFTFQITGFPTLPFRWWRVRVVFLRSPGFVLPLPVSISQTVAYVRKYVANDGPSLSMSGSTPLYSPLTPSSLMMLSRQWTGPWYLGLAPLRLDSVWHCRRTFTRSPGHITDVCWRQINRSLSGGSLDSEH